MGSRRFHHIQGGPNDQIPELMAAARRRLSRRPVGGLRFDAREPDEADQGERSLPDEVSTSPICRPYTARNKSGRGISRQSPVGGAPVCAWASLGHRGSSCPTPDQDSGSLSTFNLMRLLGDPGLSRQLPAHREQRSPAALHGRSIRRASTGSVRRISPLRFGPGEPGRRLRPRRSVPPSRGGAGPCHRSASLSLGSRDLPAGRPPLPA